jgi:hypothetical protein
MGMVTAAGRTTTGGADTIDLRRCAAETIGLRLRRIWGH